jgi:hypothetical protein
MDATEGRYIGDVRDKSAPTEISVIVLRQGSNEFDSSSRREMSSRVILSTFIARKVHSAKGLSHWASRCFAAAQHDRTLNLTDVQSIFETA